MDATRIEVVLAGPTMHATGNVKSVVEPPKKSEKPTGQAASRQRSRPMLKQDQPVKVTAASLRYDGTTSKATYEGTAQLWQGDTSIKGDVVGIEQQDGRPLGLGLRRDDDDARPDGQGQEEERVRNMGASKEFRMRGRAHLATYTGDVHLNGPSGRRHRARNSRHHLEGIGRRTRTRGGVRYDEQPDACANRAARPPERHLTYTSADEIYVVTGLPVAIVDQMRPRDQRAER